MIRLKYNDGCEIIIDGEDRYKEAAFIEGSRGKLTLVTMPGGATGQWPDLRSLFGKGTSFMGERILWIRPASTSR